MDPGARGTHSSPAGDGPRRPVRVTIPDRPGNAWHRRGVARRLLTEIGDLAHSLGYRRLRAVVLAENRAALDLLTRVFPGSFTRWDDGQRRVECPLGAVEIVDQDLLAVLC